MKLWKKGILITSALLLAAGMMAGCGGEKQATSSASGKNVLKVATNATYVPFEFKQRTARIIQAMKSTWSGRWQRKWAGMWSLETLPSTASSHPSSLRKWICLLPA